MAIVPEPAPPRPPGSPVPAVVVQCFLAAGGLATLGGIAPTGVEAADDPDWTFTDVSEPAGVAIEHRFDDGFATAGMAAWASGGMAAGDIDGDGFVDLIVIRADAGAPLLLVNRGDGTFRPRHGMLSMLGASAMAPTLGDFTGDGLLDLVTGAIRPSQPQLLAGTSGVGFRRLTDRSDVRSVKNTFSSALGDIDRDGDLDLALSHWDRECREGCGGDHLWENTGAGRFGRHADWILPGYDEDFSFTPNFADVDSDGWPDLLVAADLRTSRVFINQRGAGFLDITDRTVITDSYGMGAAIGDYDNDGDLDWFVSSNQNPADPDDGNRLYRNRGDGVFVDVTRQARVGPGGWGWGACFADFDNDGWLDIFHTNGWYEHDDASRLFMNRGNGRFREEASRYGLQDDGSGRGVACFDYDRDGDVDVFVANHNGPTRLYRNDGANASAYLSIRLRDGGMNTAAVGGRVYVTANGMTQMRELSCGNNYVSQSPTEAHFGLGSATRARVRVVWPDGTVERLGSIAVNQHLSVDRGTR